MSGIEVRALPCEGCGTDVVVRSQSDGADISEHWAAGVIVMWCPDCWAKREAP